MVPAPPNDPCSATSPLTPATQVRPPTESCIARGRPPAPCAPVRGNCREARCRWQGTFAHHLRPAQELRIAKAMIPVRFGGPGIPVFGGVLRGGQEGAMSVLDGKVAVSTGAGRGITGTFPSSTLIDPS